VWSVPAVLARAGKKILPDTPFPFGTSPTRGRKWKMGFEGGDFF